MSLRTLPPLGAVTAAVFLGLAPQTATGQVTRVSVATDGSQLDMLSTSPAISANGRHVVFRPEPNPLTTPLGSLLVRDRAANTTTPVSLHLNPSLPADDSRPVPSVSADGRFIALRSAVLDRQSGVQFDLPGLGVMPSVISATVTRDGSRAAYLTDLIPWAGDPGGTHAYRSLVVHTLGSGMACQYTAPFADFSAATPPLLSQSGALAPTLSLSADGRFVAFTSLASYLAPGGPTGAAVYVFDCATRTMSLGSLSTAGRPLQGGNALLSADARYLAFGTHDLEYGPLGAIVVRDRSTGVTSVGIASTLAFDIAGLAAISDDGRFLTIVAEESGQTGVYVVDRTMGTTRRVDTAAGGGMPSAGVDFAHALPAASADGRYVTFASSANNLVAGDTNGVEDVFLRDLLDTDGDTMTDDWETFFGLDPRNAADAALDSDADGKTNVQEFAAGTHPRALPSATRYFAEGASNDFFDTRIAVSNPNPISTAHVLLRFVKPDGSFATQLASIGPQHAYHLLVDALPAVNGSAFSTVVESDVPVVADRLMWWAGTAYGTHAEHSVSGPALSWYFAEGATHSGFELFYLILNPQATASSVHVRYLLPGGGTLERTYSVPPNTRFNIWVDQELFGGVASLANTDVSAVFAVQNGVPVIVERAMYLSPPGGPVFSAGHASVGVTAPAASWFFAEGATGTYFDEYLLVANPGASSAQIRVRYLLDSGQTYTKDYTVPANSRFNIWVDEESIPGFGKVLTDAALSIQLDVVSGPTVVAERAMWWPGPTSGTWQEAHNVVGSTVAARRWGFADGAVSGPPGNTETYLLVANTSSITASVKVTLLYTDGTPAESTVFSVAPTSRFNVHIRSQFPNALDREFGAIVESLGASAPPIVVERAVYNDANGLHWAAGAASLGEPLP